MGAGGDARSRADPGAPTRPCTCAVRRDTAAISALKTTWPRASVAERGARPEATRSGEAGARYRREPAGRAGARCRAPSSNIAGGGGQVPLELLDTRRADQRVGRDRRSGDPARSSGWLPRTIRASPPECRELRPQHNPMSRPEPTIEEQRRRRDPRYSPSASHAAASPPIGSSVPPA